MATEKLVTDRKAFAESIRPAVKGKSDRFSWRLYQRALKNGREAVYMMAWNPLTGRCQPDVESLKAGWISSMGIALGRRWDDNWFHGNNLATICRPGASRMDWAYSPAHGVADWIDITDWFWTTYQRHGRCRFFRGVHEWVDINRNARKCAHCGKHERRQVVTRKTIERTEVWA